MMTSCLFVVFSHLFFSITFATEVVSPDSGASPQFTSCNDTQPQCDCSSNCSFYGECCLDAPIRINQTVPTTCESITIFPSVSYYLVSSCPLTWKEHYTRYFCENTFEGFIYNDLLQKLPVSSAASKLSYRNIFCAICNNESKEILAWNTRLECSVAVVKSVSTLTKNCQTITYDPPKGLRGQVRHCNSRVISTCKRQLNTTEEEMCRLYYDPVKMVDDYSIYRNRYCARCNNDKVTTMYRRPEAEKLLPENNTDDDLGDSPIMKLNVLVEQNVCPKENILFSWSIIGSETNPFGATCLRASDVHLKGPGMDCPVHGSCSAPNMSYNIPLHCNCFHNCNMYGDCCYDAIIPETESAFLGRFQCLNPPDASTDKFFYWMISDCSSSWPDDDTRHSCEDKEQDDGFHRIPVTSTDTNVTYRNFFCAICNKEKTSLLSWTMKTNCSNDDIKGKNSTEIEELCSAKTLTPPKEVTRTGFYSETLRLCSPDIISKCPESFVDSRCSKYFAPVMVQTIVYKNEFCALCHGRARDEIQCPDSRQLKRLFAKDYFDQNFNILGVFDLLMKIDLSTVNQRCPKDHITANKKSESHHVDLGYTCVKTFRNFHLLSYRMETDLTVSCQKVSTFTDYQIDIFGTATITNSSMTFENGTYRILSNSSLLVCWNQFQDASTKSATWRDILEIVCLSISLLGLFLKAVAFYVIPEVRSVPNRSVLVLCLSLFGAQLLLLVGIERHEIYYLCLVIACLIHYLFLVSFFWMNVLSYDIYRKFSSLHQMAIKAKKKKIVVYNLYAWLTPLVIVFLSLGFESSSVEYLQPKYGIRKCWFNSESAHLVFFIIPLAVILLVNISFFVATTLSIYKSSKESQMAREGSSKKDTVLFVLYIKLAVIMGLTWTLGFVAAHADSDVLWSFHIVCNGLQGAFMFVGFTNLKQFGDAVTAKVTHVFNSLSLGRDVTSSDASAKTTQRNLSDQAAERTKF